MYIVLTLRFLFRDVSAGATGASAVAPKFSDTVSTYNRNLRVLTLSMLKY